MGILLALLGILGLGMTSLPMLVSVLHFGVLVIVQVAQDLAPGGDGDKRWVNGLDQAQAAQAAAG